MCNTFVFSSNAFSGLAKYFLHTTVKINWTCGLSNPTQKIFRLTSTLTHKRSTTVNIHQQKIDSENAKLVEVIHVFSSFFKGLLWLMMKCSQLPIVSNTKLRVSPKWFQDYSTQSSLFHPLFFIFLSFACFIFCWAPKWMVAGQVGRRGVAVRLEFARETSAFEQEPAPIQYQVKTELIARETTQNS